jgi:uncharacterized protein (DUF58 family)
MLTSRGWWFLITVLSLLTLGVFDERSTLTVLSLTLLFWFLGNWLLFSLRLRFAVPSLRIRREVHDERGLVDTLWTGRTFLVRVKLHLSSSLDLPYFLVTDRVPRGIERLQEESERDGALAAEEALVLNYSIRCPAAGRIRFEGLALQLADFQGFFYAVTFIPGVKVYRVLPPLADVEGHRPSVKRHNLLPSPGVHRHLRPGSGSELLDLRDYLPGDPPKTIAWKVSARRDRLITKEFESEVPIRCTLFVDTSQSVRVGIPGQNALARLVEIAAATAQATLGARDLIGVCLFDEKGVSRLIRPARGSRHLVHLFNLLADAAALVPATGKAKVDQLLPRAYSFAQEVYPYLLRPEINRMPGWISWLWPLPLYTGRRSGPVTLLARGLFVLIASLPLAGLFLLCYFLSDLLYPILPVFLPLPPLLLEITVGFFFLSLAVLYYALANVAYRFLTRVLAGRRRRLARWRKAMAALLAQRYGLMPGGLGLLLEDNGPMVHYLQQFLAEHHIPYPLPLYDRQGRYLFASPGKVDVLARALLRAVGKGRDNELFVLVVDLLELVDHLDPLLKAVTVTLTRHHQILVLCPWPPGVPVPDQRRRRGEGEKGRRGEGEREGGRSRHSSTGLTVSPSPLLPFSPSPLLETVQQATTGRLHLAFRQLQRTFARLGVPVVCAASGDPVRLILDRINQLKAVGTGRRR